jgi:hypothetical protein
MPDLWLPPPPPCASIMQAADALTVRTTPSPTGQRVGSILAGAVVRVDLRDVCLPYGAKWRYTRLISAVGVQVREPLYIALEEVASTGTVPLLRLVRDECDDVPAPPVESEEPELPEIPEETFMDWVELEVKKLNVILPFLHDKLGTDQLKALLSPQSVAVMQEVIVGASTPDVDPPPVEPPVEPEPDPETPPPPPVEEWHPVEPEPEPETPPVVEPPVSQLAPFRVANGQILKDGRQWKFTGVNFREIAYYGTNAHPQSRPEHVDVQLQGAQDTKMQVVRFWCFHPQFSIEQSIERVRIILNKLQARGMYATLVLTDGAPQGEFFVPDTPENKDGRYTWKWIENGYRNGKYWEAVDKITRALGSHPAVFSWQQINEATAPTYPLNAQQCEAMLDFWRQTSNLIRKNSPTKLISTGNISCWELFVLDAYGGGQYARKLALLPNIDIMTWHTYFDNSEVLGGTYQHIQNEMNQLKDIQKVAFIVEEVMTMAHDEGDQRFKEFVKRVFPFVNGIMLWAVSFPYGQDINAHGGGIWNAGNRDAKEARRWHNVMGWVRSFAEQLALQF